MGTTYHIKTVTHYFKRLSNLENQINERLLDINNSMSTYIPDSEISRFNQLKDIEEKFPVSDDLFQVLKTAREMHDLTEGAWDGTIKPLVDLWGFGGLPKKKQIPESHEIDALLADTGFYHIELVGNGYLRKKKASVTLDLASIAKGYAVDQLARLMLKNGITDFMVEIGGEVSASGFRKDGRCWRIGINLPHREAAYHQVYKVLSLCSKSLATSGDYRSFFELNGKRYSHVIDPKTGRPVENGIVSVSVLADDCMVADALATGIMVMGYQKGLNLIDRLESVESLIVVEKDGQLMDYPSKGFENLLQRTADAK
jgi:thiamine biosynthesis lipoprotein